jgi:hypothetical protein
MGAAAYNRGSLGIRRQCEEALAKSQVHHPDLVLMQAEAYREEHRQFEAQERAEAIAMADKGVRIIKTSKGEWLYSEWKYHRRYGEYCQEFCYTFPTLEALTGCKDFYAPYILCLDIETPPPSCQDEVYYCASDPASSFSR